MATAKNEEECLISSAYLPYDGWLFNLGGETVSIIRLREILGCNFHFVTENRITTTEKCLLTSLCGTPITTSALGVTCTHTDVTIDEMEISMRNWLWLAQLLK